MEFGPPPQIDEDDLVDLLRRNFEAHWIVGLLEDPSSFSIFAGNIATVLRIQDAIDRNLYEGTFILTAPGRGNATSVVRLTRPSGAAGEISIFTRFQDDRGAIWFPIETFSVPLSGGPQTVDVPIRTDRYGYYLNTFEPLTYVILDDLFDPNLVVVAGPDPAENGTSAFLDQHGKERRVFRAPGESDQTYRNRIRFIEDQVSPQAIARTVIEVLGGFPLFKPIVDLIVRYGLRSVREPFADSAQLSLINFQGQNTPFFDDLHPFFGAFFDDLKGPFIRDLYDAIAWFDVLLPTPVDPEEARQFIDDADPDFGAFFDDPLLAFFDLPASESLTAPIAALADELDRRRAAGVRFAIYQGGLQRLVRSPPLDSLVQVGDWTDQDGAVADTPIVTAVEDHDGDFLYVFSVAGAGPGAPLAAGDLVFEVEGIPEPLEVSHVVIRGRARREDVGSTDPELAFIWKSTTQAAEERQLSNMFPYTIDHDAWIEYVVQLDENPDTAAPWVYADVAGAMRFGVANVSAGPTNELRVSELRLEIHANYG